LTHKIKDKGIHTTQEFDTLKQAEEHIQDTHALSLQFSRKGQEFSLNGMRLFIEDIEGLPPTIEVISQSKESLDALWQVIQPVELFSDSVPALISKSYKKAKTRI
jgi:hypothetical protein